MLPRISSFQFLYIKYEFWMKCLTILKTSKDQSLLCAPLPLYFPLVSTRYPCRERAGSSLLRSQSGPHRTGRNDTLGQDILVGNLQRQI